MRRRVLIYDPNFLNPYGLELAAVLRDGGFQSELVHPRGLTRSVSGVVSHGWAQGEKGSLAKRLIDRLLAPVHVAVRARRSPLVVVWTRGAWDALVFTARSLLVARCTVVYHNPRQVRSRTGIAGAAERLLLRSSRVVVHNNWLARLASEDFDAVTVAPHPPYRMTVGAAGGVSAGLARGRVVAFVGGLRPDKGSHELTAIAEASGGGWELRIAGADRLSTDDVSRLSSLGVSVSYAADGAPSDRQLIEAIRAARVVIAPYRSVTESGSIHMALAANAPVIAFDSPGIRHMAPRVYLVQDAQALGNELRRRLNSEDVDQTDANDRAHEQTIADWVKAING